MALLEGPKSIHPPPPKAPENKGKKFPPFHISPWGKINEEGLESIIGRMWGGGLPPSTVSLNSCNWENFRALEECNAHTFSDCRVGEKAERGRGWGNLQPKG